VVIGRECRKATLDNALDFGRRLLDRARHDHPRAGDAVVAQVGGHLRGVRAVADDEGRGPDPNNLRLSIKVNGETRQDSTTARMVYKRAQADRVRDSMYTLYPGDLIFSGTPEGVGPVKPGDVLTAEIERVGRFDIRIAPEYAE